jgi:hypothetical protein
VSLFQDQVPALIEFSLPDAWDFDQSATRVRQLKDKRDQVDVELLRELMVARVMLSQEGRPKTGTEAPTWDEWCTRAGLVRRTANRWLSEYDLETGTRLEKPAIEAPSVSVVETGTSVSVSGSLSRDSDRSTSPDLRSTLNPSGDLATRLDIRTDTSTSETSAVGELAETVLRALPTHPPTDGVDGERSLTIRHLKALRNRCSKLANALEGKGERTQGERDLKLYVDESIEKVRDVPILSVGREHSARWQLVDLAQDADEPRAFLKALFTTFYNLKQSGDKFWTAQPFTAIRILSEGIMQSVCAEMANEAKTQVSDEMLEQISKMSWA